MMQRRNVAIGIAGMNGKPAYIVNWLKNGWKTAKREPVKNKALWVSSVVPLHHEPINNSFTNILFIFFFIFCDATA
jgi:hypothetical protein